VDKSPAKERSSRDAETDKTRVAAENIPHAWRLNGADPVPDVEDKAQDHKDPSPTAHSAANRAVGKDVEQGRIGKDDQPRSGMRKPRRL
jgi:hypothetical protein